MTNTMQSPSSSPLRGRTRLSLASAMLFALTPALVRAANVSVPASTQIGNGASTSLAVTIDDATGVEAGDFQFSFSPTNVVSVSASVAATAFTANCTVVGNNGTPGTLRVAMACMGALSGGGTLFTVPVQATAPGSATVDLTSCSLNEDAIPCTPV